MRPIEVVLSRLSGVRRVGDGWKALCPVKGHGEDGVDTDPSLSITEAPDGKVLLRCKVGCSTEDVLAALGLTWADLFPDGHKPTSSRQVTGLPKRVSSETPSRPITLAELVRDKSLPADFLKGLGLHDLPGGAVGIPYKDVEGKVAEVKKRTHLVARKGSRWPAKKPVFPYGLERLALAREKGRLLLVEGESDCWTAWHHGLPALGLPGASATGCLQRTHLEDITLLVIWQEPDGGGEKFTAGLARRLKALGWQGEAKVIKPPEGIKDLCDLHRAHPEHEGFKATLKGLAEAAEPLPEPAEAETARPSDAPMLPMSRCLADVQAKPIRWLWKGRIARGKVSILAGDPGLGKSQATVSMAAVVTTGGRWPVDGTPCEPGSVVFLSAEDDPADTIRPRLEAAGADLTRCYVIEAARGEVCDARGEAVSRPFSLQTDLGQLEALLEQIGDVALVVVDPISAYLGGADSHKNAEVRALLAPVSAVASRHEVAVLAVTHLSKAEQKALMRVIGSIGFVAAARAGYLVAKDPERPERRLFLPMKNNIAADQTGLAFTIEGRTLPGGIEPSCVMWEAQPVTMTADEALAATAEVGEERSAVAEAKDFLGEILADGPVPSKQVKAEADSAGLMWPTVRRAQRVLGVVIAREGFGPGGVWTWRLPHRCSSDPIDAQAQEMSTYGRDEHLCRTAPGNGSSEPPQAAGEEPEAEPWEAEL